MDKGKGGQAVASMADGTPSPRQQEKSKTPKKSKDKVKSDGGVPHSKSTMSTDSAAQSPNPKQQQGGKPQAKPQDAPRKGHGQAPVEGQSQASVQGQAQGDGAQPQKSKAELKADRRAKQEAQRAAKAVKKTETGSVPSAPKPEALRVPAKVLGDDPATQKREAKKLEKQQVPIRSSATRKVPFFNHLKQYDRENLPYLRDPDGLKAFQELVSKSVADSIVSLGVQYLEGQIIGSNARVMACLSAFKEVIMEYKTPKDKDLSRDLEAKLKPFITFLIQCRPLSIGMGNAIKFLKRQITESDHTLPEDEAKELLIEDIDNFITEKIHKASEAITMYACEKIAEGDVLLTYGCSSLVLNVLKAARKKVDFRVIVVDSRPKHEGKMMQKRLMKAGIKCSYCILNHVALPMREATKVILGAHGMMSNGFLVSRAGTSAVTMAAAMFNVPVLVCCETYKFSERAQADPFVFNELGDPNDLVKLGDRRPVLSTWQDKRKLTLLNLVYDYTPPEAITLVVCELGIIPCTSVPVVLRVTQNYTEF